nr:MAG TPA: hypothetical protein [Caudoviricetes sp.]
MATLLMEMNDEYALYDFLHWHVYIEFGVECVCRACDVGDAPWLSAGGGSRQNWDVVAPNRPPNFFKTLTVKTPLRACAREKDCHDHQKTPPQRQYRCRRCRLCRQRSHRRAAHAIERSRDVLLERHHPRPTAG